MRVLGAASWIAITVYSPAAGAVIAGVSSSGFSTLMASADETVRKQVQEVVNNDAQQFYQNGTVTLSLRRAINELQKVDETLTDGDAVDAIVEAVNQ